VRRKAIGVAPIRFRASDHTPNVILNLSFSPAEFLRARRDLPTISRDFARRAGMDFRVGSSVSRFREAAAVSDQDSATVAWRRLGPARIQKTPRTSQLIPGTTENNNKDNSNSKNPS